MSTFTTVRRGVVAGAIAFCGVAIPVQASDLQQTTLRAEPVAGHAQVYRDGYLLRYWSDASVQGFLSSPDGPVAGRLVRFTAGDTEICVAATSDKGYAWCSRDQVLAAASSILVAQGYTATFAGDDAYAPSSATATLADVS